MIPFPRYYPLPEADESGYKYELGENYQIEVPEMAFLPLGDIVIEKARLQIRMGTRATLYIDDGYLWDGGSSIAIDDQSMMAASLPHDVFYDMLNRLVVPEQHRERFRKEADKVLRRVLKNFKHLSPWYFRLLPRSQWVYRGVRWGHGIWSRLFPPSK